MTDDRVYENAVLDDKELQEGLKSINPKFGDFVTCVAGEAWGLPLIDQKTKALITIAVDIVNQDHRGPGNPFAAHVDMALKQGATRAEIEEILLFMCVYAGFNKVAGCFGTLNEIFEQSSVEPRKAAMISAIKKANYAIRDQKGKVVFYVLLWKRKGISLEIFDDYWRNVHGPVCARLPGQYQYWQFHLSHNEGGLWPTIPGIEYTCPQEDQFDGIAELTFETEADRQTWFKASAILMDDEHNIFSKAIGYNTSAGNSQTYIDAITTGDPNGQVGALKFHVMVQKASGVSVEEFRKYMTDSLAPAVVKSDSVLKFRLHLFEEVDNSRPDALGVGHFEPPDKQYQAAFEIAFANPLEMETFFASTEYAQAVKDQAKYVKQLLPFPERTAYTFVYDGKMTLAGARSSKVAELIAKIGATNQLKEDVVSLMSGKQNVKSGLGHYLQGIQHVGVTVDDIAKSLEFYTEVLGGKLVVGENGLVGDVIQNTLFQKEELDAIAAGIDPQTVGIPNLRSGKEEALDVRFISFGNVVVELIYVRKADTPNAANSSVTSIPSHIGHVNAMHISFNVKEGIDLNQFANMLEEECHSRGMTNVVCNRIIRVKSEAERRAVALRYNSFKFWNEPELIAAGEPEIDWSDDPMEGWSLFYCKGPNGEQLEFNQVTRKVKSRFKEAIQEYNQANRTSFIFPEAKLANDTMVNGKKNQIKADQFPSNNQEEKAESSRLYFNFSIPVNAALEIVWNVVVDKIENTSRYNPEAQQPRILERYSDGMLRQMNALGMTVKERITLDKEARAITHTLVDNPLFTGKIVNKVVQPTSNNHNNPLTISYTLDWEAANEEGRKTAEKIREKLHQAVKLAVLSAKEVAEQQESEKKSPTTVEATTNRSIPMDNKLPGANTDLVKRLFSRGEAFDVEGFLTFFTDTPLYQFGNFEVCLDKESIRKSADNFFSKISAVYHEIKMIWEVGDVVFVEMDVLYWRPDGSMIALPCSDIFRVEGDKFSELRIFMDVNPVFNPNIQVSKSASVMSISAGKTLLPPGIMRKHFAEHPEAQQRVKQGFVPKWSIVGPKWPIASIDKIALVMEMEAAGGEHNWDYFQTFFTDDIMFKVGASEEGRGWEVIADYLTWLYSLAEPQLPFTFRGTWDLPDTVIIEMDAKYVRRSDGKPIAFPCTDILRFDANNKVREWRVYPDQSELWMDHLKGQAK